MSTEVWQMVTSWPGNNPPSVVFVNPNQLTDDMKREVLDAENKDRIELIQEETENFLEKIELPFTAKDGIPAHYRVTKVLCYYVN